MLAVPQLGFWLSLCVAVGASAIVPDRVTAHTDFSAGKAPNSYSALTARIVIDQVRYIAHSRGAPTLTAFLHEHYTTSVQAAGLLASYIVRGRASHSAGAPDGKSISDDFLEDVAKRMDGLSIVHRAGEEAISYLIAMRPDQTRAINGRADGGCEKL